ARGDVRRVVRRDHQRIDVLLGDGHAEVVADEPAPPRAGVPGAGARVLRQTAEVLTRLLRIPTERRDPNVPADRYRTGTAVFVCLQGRVDAEVRLSDVGGQDARVVR